MMLCGGCKCDLKDYSKAKKAAKENFGYAYNIKRQELGIPLIPAGWTYTSRGSNILSWDNPLFQVAEKAGTPIYKDKYITFTENGIIEEVDAYFSGKLYVSPDPDMNMMAEQIIVRYNYKIAAEGGNPWEWAVLCGPDAGKGSNLKDVERILSKWGLQR
jgi:hypothetical protein